MKLLAGIAVAVALLAPGCGGDEAPLLPEDRAIAARGLLTPPVHLFADPIAARVEVLVDREKLDPDHIRFDPKFEPYEIVGKPKLERRDQGRFTHLRYEYALRCITLDCVKQIAGGSNPAHVGSEAAGFGERKTVRVKPSPIVYDDPEGGKRTLRRIVWPETQSVSRLNFADTTITGIGFPFRASVTPLPEATFRVSPWLLGAALLIAAAALLAPPAALAVRRIRRETPVVEEAEREPTALERAIALVEWAQERENGSDRRKALEVLALALEDVWENALADEARSLAWSPTSPSPERASRLLESVRGVDGARA